MGDWKKTKNMERRTEKEREQAEKIDNMSKFLTTVYKFPYCIISSLIITVGLDIITSTKLISMEIGMFLIIVAYALNMVTAYMISKTVKTKKNTLNTKKLTISKKVIAIAVMFISVLIMIIIVQIIHIGLILIF